MKKVLALIFFLAVLCASCGETAVGIITSRDSSETEVVNESDWSALATGGYYTCGIKNGELYCWGANYIGQFGNGKAWELTPVEVTIN